MTVSDAMISPGPGLGAQPGGDVERAAPVAALDRHCLAGIEADPHAPWHLGLEEPVLELDRRTQRVAGRDEHDERLVAPKLEQEAAAGGHDLADERRRTDRRGQPPPRRRARGYRWYSPGCRR